MKKALALVLALVLALSMAVSAFALDMVELDPAKDEKSGNITITVRDIADKVFYVYEGDEYYVALEEAAWEDIKITTNGNVTAELVEYDPATMDIVGFNVVFGVFDKEGNKVANYSADNDADVIADLDKDGLKEDWEAYKAALACAKELNDASEVTYYSVEVLSNVNIIKITVEENYTVHYTEGTMKVEATLDGEDFVGNVKFINDVFNYEYEEVKWTANNFKATWEKTIKERLVVGQEGYSDYTADVFGYDVLDKEYDEKENRYEDYAAVISTTAFRAIEGKDIRVLAAGYTAIAHQEETGFLGVALYDVVKGQKGVNFKAYAENVYDDENGNDKWDITEDLISIDFGFYGDQIVKGAYEITFTTGLDWFQLRELFGLKVEEDDIISYYLIDENGKVVGGKEVDYMTADITEEATFTVKGENAKLGNYQVVLEVPAAEAGEANPNTGAESVVGVVAALAVVSVATAAAVSLKK